MPTKIEKARKSFNYACKQASKCRHERYFKSCYACPDKPTCEIQERVDKNLEVIRGVLNVSSENTDPITVTP